MPILEKAYKTNEKINKCVVCNDFLPPHFMVDIPVKDLPKDQDTPQKCAYCATGKNQVTMNDNKSTKLSQPTAPGMHYTACYVSGW